MRNRKTNNIAYLIFACLVLAIVLVFFDKATLTEVSGFGAGIVTLFTGIGFLRSADAKKGGNHDAQ
jgi:hypothetical protein